MKTEEAIRLSLKQIQGAISRIEKNKERTVNPTTIAELHATLIEMRARRDAYLWVLGEY